MKIISLTIILGLGVSLVLTAVVPNTRTRQEPDRESTVPAQNTTGSNCTTPQPNQDEIENMDRANQTMAEKLRQDTGSEVVVYYVSLSDGRLQRLQYAAAPVNQYPQDTNQQLNEYRQNDEEAPNMQPRSQSNYQGNEQQYNRQQQQFGEPRGCEQSEDGQHLGVQQKQKSPGEKEAESGEPNQIVGQYKQASDLNEKSNPSFVSSVQFSDVSPINGPIFVYNPSSILRIIR